MTTTVAIFAKTRRGLRRLSVSNAIKSVALILAETLFVMAGILIIMFGIQTWADHREWAQTVITIPDGEPTLKEFREAHAYHGIISSQKDEGEWVFWRNGKRCRLFAYKAKEKK